MLLDIAYNFLKPEVLSSFKKYILEDLGPSLFATDDEVIYGNRHIQAFNLTFTTDKGWNNLSKLYPGFDDYLEKVVDFNMNMVHLVILKGGIGAEIELHQDDTLEEHLENNTNSPHKSIFLGVDPICSDTTTVVYLDIPKDMKGGEFYIPHNDGVPCENGQEKKYIKPCSNFMVKFPGSMWHGANKVEHVGTGHRLNIVCEQYKLSKRNLRRLEEYDNPLILKG